MAQRRAAMARIERGCVVHSPVAKDVPMRLSPFRPAMAVLALASLTFVAGANAGQTNGYLRIDGLQGTVKEAHHMGWFEMPNHDMDFDEAGACDVTAQAILEGGAAALIFKMRQGNVVPEMEIELTTSVKGVATYYSARLTNVKITKVHSRSVWGGAFDELELSPSQVQLTQKRMKPDGTFVPSGQVQVSCNGSTRFP